MWEAPPFTAREDVTRNPGTGGGLLYPSVSTHGAASGVAAGLRSRPIRGRNSIATIPSAAWRSVDPSNRAGASNYTTDRPEAASMTRVAARRGFETLLEDLSNTALREFDVGAALRGGTSGPGGKVVDKLLGESRTVRRKVVRPELRAYKRDTLDQFDVLLEYAESEASFESYVDAVLKHDRYAQALRPRLRRTRADEIREWIASERRALADAVRPLLEAPEDEFWPAVETAFDLDEAIALVDQHFRLAEPFRRYPEAFAFETDVDPGDVLDGFLASRLPSVTVEYTDEAARALQHAERQVVEDTKATVERTFGGDGG